MRAATLDLLGRGKRIDAAGLAGMTRPGMSLVEIGGAVLRVRDSCGSSLSRTVILVPDPPNVIEHYDRLIGALEKRYRVICFDLPGFGFSVPPRAFRFSVDEYAEIAIALLQRLGIEAPIWASSCLPSYVGMRVAARYPNVLSGFVCGQAPSWAEESRWARRIDRPRVLSRPVVGQLFMRVAARRVAAGWYEVAAPTPHRAWIAKIGLESLERGASYSLASSFQGFFSGAEDLGPATVPTVFVWGLRDRTHRKTDRGSAQDNVREAQIVELDDCAHFPELERPDRFAELIDGLAGLT